MSRLRVPDPFAPGRYFEFEPAGVLAKCEAIWESHEKDHAGCRHCQELRAQIDLEAQNLALLTVLGQDPKDVQGALEFSEMVKPWGKPLAGPCDTQPFRPIEEEGIVVATEDEVGFDVVEA